MEHMKALHLTLFVGKLDLSNLYGVGGLYFVITSRSHSAVVVQFVYSLISIPIESFFPVFFSL